MSTPTLQKVLLKPRERIGDEKKFTPNQYNKLEKVTTNLLGTIKRLQTDVQDYQWRKTIAIPQNKPFFKMEVAPSSTTKANKSETSRPPSRPASSRPQSVKTNTSTKSPPKTNNKGDNANLNQSSNVTPKNSATLCIPKPALMDHPLKAFQNQVAIAIRLKKTFTVRGNWPVIRRALMERGWIEKLHPSFKDQLLEKYKPLLSKDSMELVSYLNNEEYGSLAARIIKSNVLRNNQVDFYWSSCFIPADAFNELSDKYKITMVNRFRRNVFSYTTKAGLCEASKIAHWYHEDGVSKLSHPRSYNLSNEYEYFWQDFNITSAMCLLKYITETYEKKTTRIVTPCGKIPFEVFEFAINECSKLINQNLNADLDNNEFVEASQSEWEQFGDYFFKMVYLANHFKKEKPDQTDEIVASKAKMMLETLNHVWPYLEMDGCNNIWILKPANGCRGRGIHICRTRQYIMSVLKQSPNSAVDKRYIAQKYIERPLLIYNTKFDIRQWFLISSSNPLTIWIWKEFYVRFSSQTYTLRKLHESIHLTNNCVQCKYFKNNVLQDAALPNYSMWDVKQFQNYLTNIGYSEVYERIIFPGLKQNIIAATLINRDTMDLRKNSFELFGADFMLTSNFQPWLIEINANPAMSPSTPITARLCPKCQEDIIRVVIDYRDNKDANTGSFELIYKDNKDLNRIPEESATNLELKGSPLIRNYFWDHLPALGSGDSAVTKQAIVRKFSKEIKDVLQNLLQLVRQFQE